MFAGIRREEDTVIVVEEYDRLQRTVWLVFWVHKQAAKQLYISSRKELRG